MARVIELLKLRERVRKHLALASFSNDVPAWCYWMRHVQKLNAAIERA